MWRVFTILDDLACTLLLVGALGFVAHLDRAAASSKSDQAVTFIPVAMITELPVIAEPAPPPQRVDDVTAAQQRAQYAADTPKTIIAERCERKRRGIRLR